MRTKRSQRFALKLNEFERRGLTCLAEHEGLSDAATLRRLLRRAIAELPANDMGNPAPVAYFDGVPSPAARPAVEEGSRAAQAA